jgi:hypothetical protein
VAASLGTGDEEVLGGATISRFELFYDDGAGSDLRTSFW